MSVSNGKGVQRLSVSDRPELDPDDYMHAKKKLKDAMLEHYR
jgi:hypothetical protein